MGRANSGISFRVGAAPALVVEGAGSVSFVSGGTLVTVAMEANDEGAAITVNDGSGAVRVASGKATDVARTYAGIVDGLSGRSCRRSAAIKAAAFLAGAALAVVLACTVVQRASTSTSTPTAQDLAVREMLMRMQGGGHAPVQGAAAEGPSLLPAPTNPGTEVLPRPSFLEVPKALPELPNDEAAEVGAKPAQAAEVPSEDDAPAFANPGPVPVPAPAIKDAPKAPAPAAVPSVSAAPTAPAKTQAAAVPAPKPSVAQPEESVKNEAKATVDGLMKGGMTQKDALDTLATLQSLSNVDAGDITPEMLKGLPHEVAKILVDSGLARTDASGASNDPSAPARIPDDAAVTDGVPHRIIRLPNDVMERHVGKDGIPNIPPQNSWASTGNSVSLPLPGGGDVKTPEDLLDFHLKP